MSVVAKKNQAYDESHDPSFLLGQLVGTAQTLQKIVETLKDKVEITSSDDGAKDLDPDCDIHQLALLLLERELAPYEPYLIKLGKSDILDEMRRIYRLKVEYDFEVGPLDELAYYQGYQIQIEKFKNEIL